MEQLGSTTLGSCQTLKFPTSYFCSQSLTASCEASEEMLAASSVCLLHPAPASHVFWTSIRGALLSKSFKDCLATIRSLGKKVEGDGSGQHSSACPCLGTGFMEDALLYLQYIQN